MITLLFLILSWIAIMFIAMSMATLFYIVYITVLLIGKIFKSAKIEAKAKSIRKKSSMKYWTDKEKAKKESKKIAKENDINNVVNKQFEKPTTLSEAASQGYRKGKMKQAMKKQQRLNKKQAKLNEKMNKN